jgi:hypothetical protein
LKARSARPTDPAWRTGGEGHYPWSIDSVFRRQKHDPGPHPFPRKRRRALSVRTRIHLPFGALLLFFFPSFLSGASETRIDTVPSANTWTFPDAIPSADTIPALRVPVYFANLPKFEPVCTQLEAHYLPGMSDFLPAFSTAEVRRDRGEFTRLYSVVTDQIVEVGDRRQAMQQAARDYLLRFLSIVRARETNLLGSTFANEKLGTAQASLLWELWNLTSAEGELRDSARAYYDLYARAYPYQDESRREGVLRWFAEREECLIRERRSAYEEMHRNWVSFFHEAAADAGSDTLSATAGGPPARLPVRATDPGQVEWDVPAAVGATLDQVGRLWSYSWLAPEASLNSSVYKRLLAAEEQLLRNGPLHQSLEAAARANPQTGPGEPFPGDESRQKVRLRISRLRARQAQTYFHQKDVMLEAGFAKRLSAIYGLTDAGAQLANDVGRLDGLILGESPYLPWAASAAIAKRFLGTTLDVMVTSPLKDLAVAGARRVTGANWKTSGEKNMEEFLVERQGMTRKIRLLARLADSTTSSYEGGLALGGWISQGALEGTPPPGVGATPFTIREMLEDQDFHSGFGGGLAHVLAILPEDPVEQTRLYLTGARHAMSGRTRAAYSRIAMDRSVAEPAPDGRVQERAVLELFKDLHPDQPDTMSIYQILSASAERLYFSMPVVAEIQALRGAYTIPDQVKNIVRTFSGGAFRQEEYLLHLVKMEEWADQLLGSLQEVDFDLDRLERDRPSDFAPHLILMARSPEWVSAMEKVRAEYWERSKLDILARSPVMANGRMADEGGEDMAMAQNSEELERTDLAVRAGRARLEYDILTFDFSAAAAQMRGLEPLENARLATMGSPDKVSFAVAIQDAEGQALANELAGVYKEIYLAVLNEVVFSLGSVGLGNFLLGSTLGKEIGEESFNLAGRLGSAFNPWMGKFSAGGVWSTLSGGMVDGIKVGAAQSLDQAQQTYLGERFFTDQEIESGLDAFWTLTEDYRDRRLRDGTARLAAAGVNLYAGTRNYDALLEEARGSKSRLASEYDEPMQDALTLFQEATEAGDAEGMQTAEMDIIRLNGDGDLTDLRFRYQQTMSELETASVERLEIQKRLAGRLEYLPVGNLVKSRILDAAGADPEGMAAGAAAVYGQAELRSRIALGIHDLDDLRSLVDDDAGGNRVRGHLLKTHFDIDMLRSALKTAKARASDDAERAEVTRIAEAMDDERIKQIGTGVDEFLAANPVYAEQVEAVIQGGAAKRNPEYRGIFGDIDFTVFLREGATVREKELQEAMQDFFRRRGYPLAESAARPSSMDSEVFVQPWALFDPSQAGAVDIIKDLQEKSNDPTRFYSEAGARWFRNNVVFSGVVLWGNQDRGAWQRVEPHEAHALVLDMARYMGFLTDPHYDQETLSTLRRDDPDAHLRTLESFLGKTKYPLRGFDGYIISHDEGEEGHRGTDLYHARATTAAEVEARRGAAEEGQGADRDASYHEQIARNVESMVASEAEGRTQTIFRARQGSIPSDAEVIRWMADLKLKGVNPNPWKVLDPDGVGDDGRPTAVALDRAEFLLWRVRELMPEILAHTGAKWQAHIEAAVDDPDPAVRRQALSEVARTVSTLRNVMDLDDYGASALFIPPDPSIADPEARQTAHRNSIRNQMGETYRRRKELQADLAQVARDVAPETDLTDEQAKSQVDDKLTAREQALSSLRGEVVLEEQTKVLPWIRHLNSLALRALTGGGGR